MTKHSLKAQVYHHRMVDAHLASRDRYEDCEVVRQESRRSRTPSEMLVLAALDDAVLILEYGPRARDFGVYMETRRWVESHAVYPFSFVWICQHFGFDEDAVREKLLNIEPSHIKRTAVRPSSANMGPRPVISSIARPRKRKVGYHLPRAVA